MASPSVTPHDCALVVGIPIDRRTFMEDLRSPDAYDFAASVKEKFRVVDDRDAWRCFEAMARNVRRTCRTVRCYGVTVRARGGLADLADLTSRFPVVTVLTHCRFPPVCPGDITSPIELLGALQEPRGRVEVALRDEIHRRRPDLLSSSIADRSTDEVLRTTFAEVIRVIVDEAHAWYERNPAEVARSISTEADPFPMVRLTRVALEQAFPNAIRPGRAIEFRGGMSTVGQVVDAIPPEFEGLIDLTVCTSAVFGPVLKWRLGPRPRRPLVVVNRHLADLEVRIAQYKLIIGELARQPEPYTRILTMVHREFRGNFV